MIYFDTSSVVKLVMPEIETVALQTWMKAHGEAMFFMFFSSQLLRVELLRAVARVAPHRRERAREVLKGFALVRMDDEVVEAAENLHPPDLRSLDAIHLATARMFRKDLIALVAYDKRLIESATALGLKVVAP